MDFTEGAPPGEAGAEKAADFGQRSLIDVADEELESETDEVGALFWGLGQGKRKKTGHITQPYHCGG